MSLNRHYSSPIVGGPQITPTASLRASHVLPHVLQKKKMLALQPRVKGAPVHFFFFFVENANRVLAASFKSMCTNMSAFLFFQPRINDAPAYIKKIADSQKRKKQALQGQGRCLFKDF